MTRIKSDPEHVDSMSRMGGGVAMGGGRRKQSKPIRVFMDAADTPLPTAAEELAEHDRMQDSTMSGDMEVDSALPESYPLDTDSQQSGPDDNANTEGFPTKYHQLGSVFHQESQIFSKTNGGEASPEAPSDPADKRPVDMETEGVVVGKNKIFHQDAYCELCDREFCNKYFLKTHKANMHGVFEDETEAPMPVSASLPTLPPPLSSLPMPVSMPPTAPLHPRPANTAMSLPNGGNRSPTSDISKLIQAAKQQGGAPMSSIPRGMPATPPKTASTPSKPSGGAKPGHDMEDYCEICQKHFCNKYYLKKHKQDVHGIVPEPSPASAGKRGRPPMSAQLVNPPISMPSSLSASLANSLIMPPVMSSAPINGPQPGLPGLGNVMLINPFAPPMLIQGLQSQPVLQGMPPGFTSHGLTVPSLQAPATTSASSESPKSSSTATTDSVLNAEAYCEICRKEFCNKYFLRVHKATKHGIFLDEDMMPTTGPQSGLPVLNVPAPASDLPPGTINITPKDPDSLLKAKDEDSNEPPPKFMLPGVTKEGEQSEQPNMENAEACHLCKKQFVNKYNLKVHMINAHGLTIPDFDLSPPRDNKNRSDKQPMQSTMFGNMIAAKLADRVMCDICNKEVCNKYFLKTHKIKVHGMDPAKVEAESRESPQKKVMQMKPPAFPMMIKPPDMMNSNSNPSLPDMLNKPPELKALDIHAAANGGQTMEASTPRPKDEDLLKMGIDPEAYCEICKKEFCSKYFLKTHKQNIHGIKMDPSTPLPMSNPPPGFMKFDAEGVNGLSMMARHDLMAMMARGGPPEAAIPLNLMNNNHKQQTTSGNTSPSSTADSESSGPWKWRDSPNAARERVSCDLCNKELCNKYFLRTHLLNKHGLHWDLVGPQSTATPAMPFGLPGGLPPHLLERGPMDMPLNLMPSAFMPRLPDDLSQPLDLKKSPSSSSSSQEKAREAGKQPLGWHLPMSGRHQERVECEICGSSFGDKVTLQLHMIQGHPGDVVVSARSKVNDKVSTSNFGLNLRKKYQKSRRIRGRFRRLFSTPAVPLSNGAKSIISSQSSKNATSQKKKFRCAYCQERFASRGECQVHIRSRHPSAKSKHRPQLANNKENAHPFSTAADKMDFSVAQASPLSNGMEGKRELVMQSFLCEGQGSFAPARVVLPVYETVDTSITLTLRPAQQ